VTAQILEEDELLLSYGDDDFVSIATGRKQAISKAPAVASVITSETIQEVGARDLDEVLELVPGLHVSYRGAGYNPIYSIRGIHSDFNPQVLVLLNGLPVTSLLFGNRGEVWAGMPVESISRVEIIRGPGSAVYGADAFAGTINIVTKGAEEIGGFLSGLSVGRYNETRLWALYGGSLAGWEVAASLEVLNTDGQDEIIDEDFQTSIDALVGMFGIPPASKAPGSVSLGRDSLDLRVDLLKGHWNLRAGYQGRRNGGIGAGSFGALDPQGEGTGDRFNADITYNNAEIAEDWELQVTASILDARNKTELFLFPRGAVFLEPVSMTAFAFPEGVFGTPETRERHSRISFSTFYTGVENHDVRVGGGFYHQDMREIKESKNFNIVLTPFGPLPTPLPTGLTDVSNTAPFNQEKTRKNSYLFIQDEWKFARDWSLTAGLRFDDYSDFGNTFNPRLALVWQSTLNLTTKLLYGRAFRAPSFAEQFNINNPIAIGNEALDPEIINTFELAFDYQPQTNLHATLNLFWYEMKDIISFMPQAMNAGDQTGVGLELEIQWDMSDDVRFIGNYAFQDSEDEFSDSRAPNAPRQQLYLRAEYNLGSRWDINAQVNSVFGRERAFADLRTDVEDYTIIDLILRRKDILPGLSLAVSIRNLFDEEAREPSSSPNIPNDLPLAGRSVFIEMRKSW